MSTPTPAISVIMSVKNGADCISRSIASIQSQSFTDWEMLICDDGSTDETYNRLCEIAEKDSRVRILRNKESLGLAFSLNRCIEEAKSNILARQDADDWSAVNRFEVQYPFVVSHPEYAIVGTGWFNVLESGDITPVDVMEEPKAIDQVKGGEYLHPSWMMRKDMLKKVGYYTVNKYTLRSQDYHLVMKVLGAGMRLYNMSDKLYYYSVDTNTMKRHLNWKRVPGIMWIRWDSYRRNHLPLWCYFYVLKPVVTNLLPKSLMMWYYRRNAQ